MSVKLQFVAGALTDGVRNLERPLYPQLKLWVCDKLSSSDIKLGRVVASRILGVSRKTSSRTKAMIDAGNISKRLATRSGSQMRLSCVSVLLTAVLVVIGPFLSSTVFVAKATQKDKSKQTQSVYICPMDPDVRSTSPGKCKKCGMQLRQPGHETEPDTSEASEAGRRIDSTTDRIVFPDVWVTDQNGKRYRFYEDLVRGKTVAIEFIFTTCTTICPPLTATFRKVQQELVSLGTNGVQLISISVDPETDIPERLNAFASKFNAGPGWAFITGSKAEITRITKALGANVRDKTQHSPTVVIGNDRAGYWTRAYGLASAATLTRVITDAASHTATEDNTRIAEATPTTQPASRIQEREPRPGSDRVVSQQAEPTKGKTPGEAAASYFPNVILRTQDNQPVHFFADLLKGKIVLINFVFTTCTGVCPTMTSNLKKVQDLLGQRVGDDINMISVSVDPETDTPEKLKKYAQSFDIKKGWYFLTGPRPDVDLVLRKLGGFVEDKNDHTNLLIVGNVESGNWIKVFALGRPPEIVAEILKIAPAK